MLKIIKFKFECKACGTIIECDKYMNLLETNKKIDFPIPECVQCTNKRFKCLDITTHNQL